MSSKTTTRPKSGPTPSMNGKPKPTTNAWARPLQPKPKTAGPPPGMGAPPILRERFLHLTLSMVGHRVVVHKTDGSTFEGIFHTFTPFAAFSGQLKNKYVFKACKAVKGGDFDTGATLILQADEVSSVFCKSMRLDTSNGNSREDGFMTDVEISGARDGKARDLVAAGTSWTSAQKPTTTGLGGSIGGWDQFNANEELFGVRATYDENLYTTELDLSQVDERRRLEAQRLAKEIEGKASSNIHIAEERGQVVPGDYDEEDRYSGVLKNTLQPRNAAAAKPELKAAAPKKMNYAAAAAKADAKAPPGFKAAVVSPRKNEPKEEKKEEATTETTPEETSAKEKTLTPSTPTPVEEEAKKSKHVTTEVAETKEVTEKAGEPKSEGDKTPDEKTDENQEEKKPTPKLNPNAKSFEFNPSAKSFTPTSYGVPPPAAPAPPVDYYYAVDPNTGVPLGGPGAPQMQGQPQYMYPGMGQPGMVPMPMGPQFAAMRYPGFPPYPGMEHQIPMQYAQQPQHVQPQAPGSQDGGSPAPPTSGDESETPQPPPPQPNQPVQVPYGGGPPGSYLPVGMMPRGPGFHPHAPPPHMGAPGGGQPYGHPMYAGPMQNMPHMRVPGGGIYYPPMSGMHYPPGGGYGGMMEDDQGYRGGGRGVRGGRGMSRRGSKRGGRGVGGRVFYPGSGGGSGRQTPQSNSDSVDGGESKTSGSPTEATPQPSGEE